MITIKRIAIGTAMLGILSLSILPPTAARADYRAGKTAYDGGDYATALKEWRAGAAPAPAVDLIEARMFPRIARSR